MNERHRRRLRASSLLERLSGASVPADEGVGPHRRAATTLPSRELVPLLMHLSDVVVEARLGLVHLGEREHDRVTSHRVV